MANKFNDPELLLRNLMENMTDNIYFKDVDSRFIIVNKAYCERIALTPDDLVGQSDFDLFANEHARQAYDDEQRIIATGEPIVGLEELETWPDGHITWVSTTKVPLRTADGEIIGTFGISRDITEHKAMENELQEARKKAEQSAQAKSAFLANMSHEIRTPLNAVVGMSGLLEDTPLTDEQKDFVKTINTSSEALLHIVNNILDLSKIEAGKFELEATPFNLVQSVENTVAILEPKATEKNLELMLCFDGMVPETVIGDAARLRQVLLNLLNNAIKFTPEGHILVEIEGTPVEDNKYVINFMVSDTGIGMTNEEMSRIFQPFEQADTSITRKYGGTGLGLSICMKLVELMGGAITVQSEKGAGTKFKFNIVVRKSDAIDLSIPPFDPSILAGRRVLVVDDNETNLRILRHELQKANMVPLTFPSGPAALEQLDKLPPIDIAVLDYTMPEMCGCTLAKSLRERPEFGNKPIIILSSSGTPRTAHDGIINRWMIKPAKERLLHATLSELLAGAKAESEKTKTPARQLQYRILLAEDNKINQLVTLKMLAKLGYTADLAQNGREAVEAALATPYDLILMDIQMPELDGLEATRILREKLGKNPSRPIIVGLSAHAMKENRDDALHAGMDDYLTKPVRKEELTKMLWNICPPTPQQKDGI